MISILTKISVIRIFDEQSLIFKKHYPWARHFQKSPMPLEKFSSSLFLYPFAAMKNIFFLLSIEASEFTDASAPCLTSTTPLHLHNMMPRHMHEHMHMHAHICTNTFDHTHTTICQSSGQTHTNTLRVVLLLNTINLFKPELQCVQWGMRLSHRT